MCVSERNRCAQRSTDADVCVVEVTEMDVERGFYQLVEVQDHVHYIFAFVVSVIGTVGVTGNALVMYAFYW